MIRRRRFKALLNATALSTLSVSLMAGAAFAQDSKTVAPVPGDEKTGSTEVVIVSNRVTAKNLQMKSQNSVSVLSAADLQHTAVHNAAEVLGLMPSVNVMPTGNSFIGGIDGASRGEGQYVSIRAMNSEYNVNEINGVEVATAQPYSRGVQLNLIPPSGLQTIVLNKTSMANMDGDAIGGTIDFRTPTAFDFHGKEGGSVSISGNYESQAQALHADDAGFGGSADYYRKFGASDNIGFYVSGYYSLRHYANSELGGVQEASGGDQAFAFSYVDANGNIPAGMDPAKDTELTGFNVGVSSGDTELWGGTIALDWKADDNTSYYVHLTYAHDFTTQNSSLNQIVGNGMVNQQRQAVFNSDGTLNSNYIAVGGASTNASQIAAAGGASNQLYQTVIPAVTNKYWYETNPEHSNLSTLVVGEEKTVGAWHFAPGVFYSYGHDDRPNHLETWTNSLPSVSGVDGGAPYGATSLVSYGSNDFPIAHLTPSMLAAANNPGTEQGLCCYELTSGLSQQTKVGAKVDASYDFNAGIFQSISFGAKYVDSWRQVSNRDWTAQGPAAPGTLGQDAIVTGYYPGFPGQFDYLIPIINHATLYSRFRSLTANPATLNADSDDCGSGSTSPLETWITLNCNDLSGSEAVTSVYVLGHIQDGNLEIIPGVRYESTVVHNTYFVRLPNQPSAVSAAQGLTMSSLATDGSQDQLDEAYDHFTSNRSHFSEFLPSLFLNYRPNEQTVYRASIWTSYTRPPFFELGGSANYSYNESNNTTTVTEGNPNLKAIGAINFDTSGAWRDPDLGYFSAGLFYKALSHYIYDAGSNFLPGPTTGSGTTLIEKPVNGGNGTVGGVEFDGQLKLSAMPEPFNGFSLGGNLTLQSSKVNLGTSWGSNERIQNAPDITGNAGVYYAKGLISFDITYHYSGAYIADYDDLDQGGKWDDLWVRPIQTVNLHAGYDFGKVKLDLSVANIFNSYSYWSHIGKNTLGISDVIQSGRTALATLKYNF